MIKILVITSGRGTERDRTWRGTLDPSGTPVVEVKNRARAFAFPLDCPFVEELLSERGLEPDCRPTVLDAIVRAFAYDPTRAEAARAQGLELGVERPLAAEIARAPEPPEKLLEEPAPSYPRPMPTRGPSHRRPNQRNDEDYLLEEKIEPFIEGKGPAFVVRIWWTGRFDKEGIRRGSPWLGYRITMIEPGRNPEVVFEGEDYSPSPGQAGSPQNIDDIVSFFVNDYEDETRTPRQREVVAEYGEDLSMEASARFGEDADRAENRRSTSRRRNPTSQLERDGTLEKLLEMQAESLESEADRSALAITPELNQAASDYEDDLFLALQQMVRQYPPAGDATAETLMEEGDAPTFVLLTLREEGAGIWDGRWDKYYDAPTPGEHRALYERLEDFLRSRLGKWASGSGSGKLEDALNDAVWQAEGGEGDDNGLSANRRRANPGQVRWNVYLGDDLLEAFYFNESMSAEEVKRSLIDHDNYDPRIRVEMPRRRTERPGVPAGRSANPSGQYRTIADIRAANREAGLHFFDRQTMRFHGTKIESGVHDGRFFVTSEQYGEGSPRRYKVREAMPDGSIKTRGDDWRHKEDAIDAIKDYVRRGAA